MRQEKLAGEMEDSLRRVYLPLALWAIRQKQTGKALVLGINGAQGAGKSTLCGFLRFILEQGYGFKVASLSLDDFYHTRAERQRLAHTIHPLLATRGAPGTHDVGLARRALQALISPDGIPTALPLFDKAMDDRRPRAEWPLFQGPADVLLFEGWCLGTRPQAESALAQPVNDLERDEDPAGIWRRHVNQQLQGPYAKLFAQLDKLVFIQVPSMDCVLRWRGLQEQKLAQAAASGKGQHIMDTQALQRFVMHYERLTRHALADLPSRADLILKLNDDHQFSPLYIDRKP